MYSVYAFTLRIDCAKFKFDEKTTYLLENRGLERRLVYKFYILMYIFCILLFNAHFCLHHTLPISGRSASPKEKIQCSCGIEQKDLSLYRGFFRADFFARTLKNKTCDP